MFSEDRIHTVYITQDMTTYLLFLLHTAPTQPKKKGTYRSLLLGNMYFFPSELSVFVPVFFFLLYRACEKLVFQTCRYFG